GGDVTARGIGQGEAVTPDPFLVLLLRARRHCRPSRSRRSRGSGRAAHRKWRGFLVGAAPESPFPGENSRPGRAARKKNFLSLYHGFHCDECLTPSPGAVALSFLSPAEPATAPSPRNWPKF